MVFGDDGMSTSDHFNGRCLGVVLTPSESDILSKVQPAIAKAEESFSLIVSIRNQEHDKRDEEARVPQGLQVPVIHIEVVTTNNSQLPSDEQDWKEVLYHLRCPRRSGLEKWQTVSVLKPNQLNLSQVQRLR